MQSPNISIQNHHISIQNQHFYLLGTLPVSDVAGDFPATYRAASASTLALALEAGATAVSFAAASLFLLRSLLSLDARLVPVADEQRRLGELTDEPAPFAFPVLVLGDLSDEELLGRVFPVSSVELHIHHFVNTQLLVFNARFIVSIHNFSFLMQIPRF